VGGGANGGFALFATRHCRCDVYSAGMADENRNHHVSLGCGTLILIAVIVLIFSNRRSPTELDQSVKALREEVSDLKRSVEAQTAEIRRFQLMIESRAPATLPAVEK
jgi:hypothetical protein